MQYAVDLLPETVLWDFIWTNLVGFDLLSCHFRIIHPINSKMKISHLSIIEGNDYCYICNYLENLIQTNHDHFSLKPIFLDIGLKDNMFFGYCLRFLMINLL